MRAATVLVLGLVVAVGGSLPASASRASSAGVFAADPTPPDNYVPAEGLLFNHPFRSDRGQILRHAMRLIRSTAGGESIKIAAFGISHNGIVDALIAARDRGVSVQVIGDAHLVNRKDSLYSPSFVRLRKVIGNDHSSPNWVMVCDKSCRGFGGNMHAKYFLFSNVTGVRNVVVTSSGNLTNFAVAGQWNHAKTVIDGATYNRFVGIFNEMGLDVPAAALPMNFFEAPMGDHWIFPWPAMSIATDPQYLAMEKIDCLVLGPDESAKRTKVRYGMYAWFGAVRGEYLARQAKKLWNEGCDVAVELSVSSKQVKSILRSRSGRGPVPVKRVGTYDAAGNIKAYNHAKWTTIIGGYDGNPNASIVIAGTCNFTGLGNYSDEFTGIYSSVADALAYNRDFDQIWRERQAATWNRTYAPGYARTVDSPDPVLGKGKLARAETD
mgnify:CR=1 FL=1